MVNLGLSNKTWVAFNIGELFEAKRPASRKEDDFDCGGVPFIASGGINNGVTKFCKLNGDILDRGNCLSISPVDGSCYYHPYDFLGRGGAGSSIILLYPKNFQLNRYVALFMSKAIAQTTAAKYSYGYMASLDRIKKDRIYLPVDDSAEIDFRFMTSFMKQKEQQILKPTIERLCKRLIENDILGGVICYVQNGNHFISRKYLPKYNVGGVSKRLIMRKVKHLTCHRHLATMVLTDSLVIKVA